MKLVRSTESTTLSPQIFLPKSNEGFRTSYWLSPHLPKVEQCLSPFFSLHVCLFEKKTSTCSNATSTTKDCDLAHSLLQAVAFACGGNSCLGKLGGGHLDLEDHPNQ